MQLQVVIEAVNKTQGTFKEIQLKGAKLGWEIGQNIQTGMERSVKPFIENTQKALKASSIGSALLENITSGLKGANKALDNIKVPALGAKMAQEIKVNLAKGALAGLDAITKINNSTAFGWIGYKIGAAIPPQITQKTQEALEEAQKLVSRFKMPPIFGKAAGQAVGIGKGVASKASGLLSGAAQGLSGLLQGFSGGGVMGAIASVGKLGFAIGGITIALGAAQRAAGDFYRTFIGRAVELEQQLLSTKATLSATNAVIVGGEQIKDPTAAIQALNAPIEQALASVREQSLELVGVTSSQLVPIFQNIAGLSSNIGASLQDSADLTVSFAAALGTLSIPLEQQRQEVASILQANISSDSTLAKSLNITNEMVKTWKSQGRLVDELNKKLEAFRAGNALAAKTIEGVTSNIEEIYENITLEVGRQFIPAIVEELTAIYEWLNENSQTIQEYIDKFANAIFDIGKAIYDVVKTSLSSFAPAFKIALDLSLMLAEALQKVAQGASILAENEFISRAAIESVKLAFIPLQAIANTLDFISKVGGKAFNFITGAGGAKRDALNDLTQSFETTTNQANKYMSQLRELEEAEKLQGELTEEQKAQRDKLSQSMGVEAQYIDQLIASYEGLDLGEKGDEMIAMLEDYRNTLSDTRLALLPLDDKGTFLYQQNMQLEQYLETLKNEAGDPAQFDAALEGIISITEQMVEAGLMSREQAKQYITDVANNTNATGEIQLKAKQSLIKLLEAEDDSYQERNKKQIEELENLRATGDKSEIDAIRAIGELRNEGLKKELEVATSVHEEKMRQLDEETAKTIEKIQAQIRGAKAELANSPDLSEGDKAVILRTIEDYESQITEIQENANTQRQKNTQEFTVEQGRINSEIGLAGAFEQKVTVSAERLALITLQL